MTTRTYGTEYDTDLTTKDIAAIVRKRLRKATKLEHSPINGWTVNVRSKYYSMGSSITVTLQAPEGVHVKHKWSDNDYQPTASTVCTICNVQAIAVRSERHRSYWLTDAGYAAELLGERLLASFNHDGSDSMTDYYDVNFSGQVNVLGADETNWARR